MSDKPEQGPPRGSRGGAKPPKKSSGKRPAGRLDGLFTGLDALPSAPATPGGGPTAPEQRPAARPPTEAPPAPKTETAPAIVAPPQAPPGKGAPAAPAPAAPPRRTGDTRPRPPRLPGAPELPARGVSSTRQPDGETVTATEAALSPLALESLKTGQPLARPAEADRPATLAYARRLGAALPGDVYDPDALHTVTPALLLEALDDDPNRVWSEDELLLVEQVTDQLTLALENARLFEEARQRNEELATLNLVAGAVSTMMELDQVLPEVLAQAMTAVGYEAGLISIVRRATPAPESEQAAASRLELAVHRGLPENMVHRLEEHGMDGSVCDMVYQTAQMLYLPDLNHLSPETLNNFALGERLAAAVRGPLEMGFRGYIGAPLVSKGKQLGTVCVFSHEPRQAPASRLRLLEAIGQQVGVVIENVRLFEETQRTADALQVSERYQKGVAQAVAALTERGMAALSEALAILGEAAQTDRVHYLETQVDQNGPYWRLINEWRMPGKPSQLSNPQLRRVGLRSIPAWIEAFRTRGAALLPDAAAPPEYRLHAPEPGLLAALGARSALLITVPGRHELPGCVVFEQSEQARPWSADEIAALQTAASALANTLAREDLFTQVQANLAETEAQYQASSRLNNAASYADILTVLRQHTILGHINAGSVALNLFDRPWTRANRPEWIISIARWSANPEAPAAPERYSLASWKNAELLLDPDRPTMVLDAAADPRLDENARNIIAGELGARSLLFVPLNVSGRWIGQIVGAYRQTTGFPDQEVRRLTSLAGQAAVAVENLRLLEETRRRNDELNAALSETEALYEAGAELNAAHNYADILQTLRDHTVVGQAGSIRIELYDQAWDVDAPPERAAVIARWDAPEWAADRELGRDVLAWGPAGPAALEALQGAGPRVVQIDAENTPAEPIRALAELYPELALARSAVIAPLVAGGQRIGHVLALYSHAAAIGDDHLRRLAALGGQAAVALQTLRLLEESQRRARQLQTAAEIARDTTASTLALDALLGRSVNLVCDRFGYCNAAIYLLDEDGVEATAAGVADFAQEMMEGRRSVRVGDNSAAGRVMASGRPLVISDLGAEADSLDPERLPKGALAELGIPLKLGDRVIGALDVHADSTDAFTADDVSVLQTLADQIAVAVDNARAYALTQKAVEEIREADRLKTQFLANMSHELRTPLNSIIGFSRVILKGIDGPINDQQAQDLSAIYSSGQHLLGLINDVLDLSRIEAGKMDLAFEDDVNLGDIIHSVMSTTVGLVKDKPIELRQRVAPDLPRVSIDPMKIRQVLINLLSNAAKFTEVGAIIVEAEPTTYAGEPGVIVRVTDSGPGIAPEDQAKLFQPFSQVDGSLTRKTGGSGLGLSICHHLVRMHGGQIGLDSDVGRGSTFYFILPLKREAPAAGEPEAAPAEPGEAAPAAQPTPQNDSDPAGADLPPVAAGSTSPGAAGTDAPATGDQVEVQIRLALAVDRDPKVTDLYRRYLTSHNLSVISLSDLGQVTAAARSLQPAIITLDAAMQSNGSDEDGPLDGWQVLKTLSEDPATRPIPVIVCTLADAAEQAHALGAAGYLLKPILEDDLVREVDRVLKDKK